MVGPRRRGVSMARELTVRDPPRNNRWWRKGKWICNSNKEVTNSEMRQKIMMCKIR